MGSDIVVHKPYNEHLKSLIDYYYFIDASVEDLQLASELLIPLPRITFRYFFEYPFEVTNHTINETAIADIVISRISTHKLSIKPLTDRVKILGAHIKPYALAFFTNQNISKLPWLIKTPDLFEHRAHLFMETVNACRSSQEMFDEVERAFLDTILNKDLSTIIKAVELIEMRNGDIEVAEVSRSVGVSNRTLRNHFYRNVGCSTKEYIHLSKLKKIVHQMRSSEDMLISISYSQNYYSQSHFTNSMKNITGLSPKEIRKKLPDFRFLQL